MGIRAGSVLATLAVGAGLVLHSSAGPHSFAAPLPGQQREQPTGVADDGDGPWKASCSYWQALRPLPRRDATGPASTRAETVKAATNNLDRHVSADQQATTDCTSAEWGVPESIKNLSPERRQAHAVIATVPDPVHSHLASEFDRAIDVLIGAAADNGYLISYSWLPWKTAKDGGAKGTSEKESDKEPGLLVFDQRAEHGETPRVLYMFLVAEMPADGVNAEQLQRALHYELQLRSQLGTKFATDYNGNLRIIGPQYSGSAMSMNLAINTVLMDGSVNTDPGSVQTRVIIGTTSTEAARRILNRCDLDPSTPCDPAADPRLNPFHVYYASFASGQTIKALGTVADFLGYRDGPIVVLQEDGTSYGRGDEPSSNSVPFPREISLLRNSYQDGGTSGAATDASGPTPYLHLTTHDDGPQDKLPDFSTDITPFSQEAQLMSISHMLTQMHAKFAYVVASNPLDAVFLAKSLHRSNPDTRLVLEPDLLLQRVGDDTPYVGSLSLTPYPLAWLARANGQQTPMRSFASGEMEAFYNAASLTLGQMVKAEDPILYGYNNGFTAGGCEQQCKLYCPRLWLTAVGSDGYYPIALLPTSSETIGRPAAKAEHTSAGAVIYPSDFWQALCVLVMVACLFHIAALLAATYASPRTCDLDIRENCAPHRRALYVQIGGAALFLMSALVSLPASIYVTGSAGFTLSTGNVGLASLTVMLGLIGWGIAFAKTVRSAGTSVGGRARFFRMSEEGLCGVLYAGSVVGTLTLAGFWLRLCLRPGEDQNLGLFFSYRCLHPMSGVSPLAPALLLTVGWYLWALLHSRRLRLTNNSRPRLPDASCIEQEVCMIDPPHLSNLFVSDAVLKCGLLEDTTCLMISRRVLQQIFRANPDEVLAGPKEEATRKALRADLLDAGLIALLSGFGTAWVVFCPMRSLDHFGWKVGATTLYDFFIGCLLAPLLIIALCAVARLFLMSASLRAQVLEPLERVPLRHAFTRLKGYSWVGMLRESGQLERWRDMARATEGIRQIVNHPDLPKGRPAYQLQRSYRDLDATVAMLYAHVRALRENDPAKQASARGSARACAYMEEIERSYAACSEQIVLGVLLPQWLKKNHGLLESSDKKDQTDDVSELARLAEEFLAIRYVAFIRAILAQMRYLLLFISAALVLVILAINSYPFQPKQELDWCITAVFFSFLFGIVVVFAQMNRNPLLSRITNKTSHGLGMDFYLRVAAFGALPLATWLATQYPSIGGMVYSVIKPGLEAFK